MSKNRFALGATIGCALLIVLLIIVVPMIFFLPAQARFVVQSDQPAEPTPILIGDDTQVAIPTLTVPAHPAESEPISQTLPAQLSSEIGSASLTALYEQVNPGVVSVQVYIEQGGTLSGQGAGSGFILDEAGHIITNDHVVAQAQQVTVIFSNEVEAEANVIGTDRAIAYG